MSGRQNRGYNHIKTDSTDLVPGIKHLFHRPPPERQARIKDDQGVTRVISNQAVDFRLPSETKIEPGHSFIAK